MYRATAVKTINADMTVIMVIFYLVAKITIVMAMARSIPGAMPGRTVDTIINEHPMAQIFIKIII